MMWLWLWVLLVLVLLFANVERFSGLPYAGSLIQCFYICYDLETRKKLTKSYNSPSCRRSVRPEERETRREFVTGQSPRN